MTLSALPRLALGFVLRDLNQRWLGQCGIGSGTASRGHWCHVLGHHAPEGGEVGEWCVGAAAVCSDGLCFAAAQRQSQPGFHTDSARQRPSGSTSADLRHGLSGTSPTGAPATTGSAGTGPSSTAACAQSSGSSGSKRPCCDRPCQRPDFMREAFQLELSSLVCGGFGGSELGVHSKCGESL